MYAILQAGSKGYYVTTGINMKVTSNPRTLVDIWMNDGSSIIDDKTYIGVTANFMLDGGDDMKAVIGGGTYIPRNRKTLGVLRDVLKGKLIEIGVIKANTLIDPNNPRLVIV
jgi:hypothetical protein